jgi:hypothetical protein
VSQKPRAVHLQAHNPGSLLSCLYWNGHEGALGPAQGSYTRPIVTQAMNEAEPPSAASNEASASPRYSNGRSDKIVLPNPQDRMSFTGKIPPAALAKSNGRWTGCEQHRFALCVFPTSRFGNTCLFNGKPDHHGARSRGNNATQYPCAMVLAPPTMAASADNPSNSRANSSMALPYQPKTAATAQRI